jgi:hypothetical protein
MHVILFIVAGLIFAYWLFGISQPQYNRPTIFRKQIGIYGVLIVAASFAFAGYLLLK